MVLDNDTDIGCQYQRETLGGLVCRLANTQGQHTTNKTSPEVCAECEVGKVERELGCKHVGGTTILGESFDGIFCTEPELWCRLRKRATDYEQCATCGLIESSAVTALVTSSLDILDTAGFPTAKRYLTDARRKLQDEDMEGCIRCSAVALESTLKSILDLRRVPYPRREQLTDLWKAVSDELRLKDGKEGELAVQAVGNMSGTVSGLAGMRNDLSDAHGKGMIAPQVYHSYAELALNLSASLITFLVRYIREDRTNG